MSRQSTITTATGSVSISETTSYETALPGLFLSETQAVVYVPPPPSGGGNKGKGGGKGSQGGRGKSPTYVGGSLAAIQARHAEVEHDRRRHKQIAALLAGPRTWTVSLSELATAGDFPHVMGALIASLAEAASAIDHPSGLARFNVSRVEPAAAADHPGATARLGVAAVETAHATDVLLVGDTIFVSSVEHATAIDLPIVTIITNVTLHEVTTGLDHPAVGARVVFGSANELATALDHQAIKVNYALSIAESAVAHDVLAASYVANVALIEVGSAKDIGNARLSVPGVLPRRIGLIADRDSARLIGSRVNPALEADQR